MNNSNLALKEWGKGMATVITFARRKEEKNECESIMEPSTTNKKYMEFVMNMIDYRMNGVANLEMMGFVAGVCKGQIIGYETAGYITSDQADQLTNYLYAKWEAMRTILEIR